MDGLNGVSPIAGNKDPNLVEKDKPAPPKKSDQASGVRQDDSTSLTARAQAEASRTQTDPDRDGDTNDSFKGEPALTPATVSMIAGPSDARDVAAQSAATILENPVLASRAQANSAGEGVLSLLR